MQARIDIGFDLVRTCSHNDERVMHDIIHNMIANIRDMLQPARQLPCLAPNLLDFAIMPVFGKVTRNRNIITALPNGG